MASNASSLTQAKPTREAELRQPLGQQVLHALGPGVVFAVDQVQDADRFDAPPAPSSGRAESG